MVHDPGYKIVCGRHHLETRRDSYLCQTFVLGNELRYTQCMYLLLDLNLLGFEKSC